MSAAEPNGDWPNQNTESATARSRDGGDGSGDGGGSVRHWGRLGGIGAALGMSAVFAVAAWYALQRDDMQPEAAVDVPLVKAEQGPVKEKPEDPGGLKIPNQDKLVYERITPKPQSPVAEKLAPAPEEPIVKTVELPKPTSSTAGSSAPAAPNIATPAAKMAKEVVQSAAVEKPAAKRDMKSMPRPKTAIAPAEKHAAPPAISSAAPKVEGAKTESLLPALDKPSKAEAKEAVPATKATAPAMAVKKTPPVAKAAVKKATVKKASAAKTAASGYRIQLASYRRAALAEKAWQRLQKTHDGILGALSGHTARADLGKRGVYYRLQAGFFNNAASARAACAKLKAKKQDCIIVPPKK